MGFGGGTGGGGTAKGGYGAPQSQNVQGWNQGGWGRPQMGPQQGQQFGNQPGRPAFNQADQDAFRSGINSLFGLNASASQPAQAPDPIPDAALTVETGGNAVMPAAPPPAQAAAAAPMDYFGGMSQEGRQQMADMFFNRFNRPTGQQQPYQRPGGMGGVYGGIGSMYQPNQGMVQNLMGQMGGQQPGGGISWTPQAQAAYQGGYPGLSPVTAQAPYQPPPQAVAQPYQAPASPAAAAGGGNQWQWQDAKRGIMPPESMRATDPTGYHTAMLAARRRQGGSQGGGDRGSH